MNAGLAFGNNRLEILNFRCYEDEIKRGNPYNSVFDLMVSSGSFSGVAPCEYDLAEFKKLAQGIHKLYDFELSAVELSDMCYGSKVKFTMDKTGHVEISGRIFGEAMEHSLEFCFQADQTVLQQFAFELDRLLP